MANVKDFIIKNGLQVDGGTFIVDDTNNRVGIGTTSPDNAKLEIASGTNQIQLNTGNEATYGRLDIGHFTNGTFIGTHAGTNTAANLLRFGISGSTKVTLDSGGLKIDTTDATPYNNTSGEGVVIKDGLIAGARSGASVIAANRMTSEGPIINLNYAGGNIGNIGVVDTNNVYINGDNVGLGIGDDNLYPTDASGSSTTGALDLGDSTAQFRHLYLSGNITVGGTVDGRDIASDGTKLDGIESGATGDQTASEILTAIKTVDGSTSGLDADLLDGVHGSSFLRSDAADTMSQLLTLNLNSTALMFDGGADNGASYNPTESGSSATRYFLRFDRTNNASYPYLTNRTPSGDVVIKTGSAAGGSENEIIRFHGGDGVRSIDISNGNLNISSGTTQALKLTTSSSGPWAIELYRSDTSFSSKVYNNGSGWRFEHTPYVGSNSNNVWHAGNDGASSGLDADLLDGQHGSYYTSYTDTAIANLIDTAPSTLDTLNELAAALGDDPNFSTTITNSIATKLPLAGGTMTGNIALGDNNLTGIGKLNFNNHEGSDYGSTGDVMFDENFYSDTEYGSTSIWSGANGGGLAVYNEDGWGRIITDRNMPWLTAQFDKLAIGKSSPSSTADFHVRKALPSGTIHYDGYTTAIIEDTEARLQIMSQDGGTNASTLLLSNNTKHWGLHHHGPTNSNIFSIGYRTSAANSEDIPNNLNDAFNISTGGNVSIGTSGFSHRLRVHSGADAQLALTSPDTWAGIYWDDANGAGDYIWFHGGTNTFAIGGGGSNVSGKKLHVDGGMTIGSTSDSVSMPTDGLYVQGNVRANAALLAPSGTENIINRRTKDIFTFTSNSTGGVAGAVKNVADEINRTNNTSWDSYGHQTTDDASGNAWLAVDCKDVYRVTHFAVSGYPNGSHKPTGDWYLQGSTDNSTWTTIGTAKSEQWVADTGGTYPFRPQQIVEVTSPADYRYYRIYATGWTNGYLLVMNLGLFVSAGMMDTYNNPVYSNNNISVQHQDTNARIDIGKLSSYTGYGAIWSNGQSDYRILFDPSSSSGHTFINSVGSAGNIYLRNDNTTLAQLNASGTTLQVSGSGSFSGKLTLSGGDDDQASPNPALEITNGTIYIPHDESLIIFDEGQKAISSNDGQGNFNIYIGKDDDGVHVNSVSGNSGIAHIQLDGDGQNGQVNIGLGPTRAGGSTANFDYGLRITRGTSGLKWTTGSSTAPSGLTTEYTIWHSGNDGRFLRSDADDSASGSIQFANSYNSFGNSTGSVSNDGNWNARVNIAGSGHARLDVKSVSDGIITSMYSHTGQGVGRVGTYSNHPLALMTNGSIRATLNTSGYLGIGTTNPYTTLTVNGTQRIEIDSNVSGAFSSNASMHRDGAIIFPVTASKTTQTSDNGGGWATIGWATTSRSGEQMHRNTLARYANGGSGTAMGFYIEAGTGEAGGICLDEDSVNVYGSSDNGTTFRVIDKDSDVVTFEMLQSSWNGVFRGDVIAYGSMSSISDRRIKENIKPYVSVLDRIMKLGVYSYTKITAPKDKRDKVEIGVIAQEVEEVFPELVDEEKVDKPEDANGLESIKTVDYEHMTAILLQAIKEQQTQIESQQEQINELKALLEK